MQFLGSASHWLCDPPTCFHELFQLRPVVTFFSWLFQSSTMFLFPRLPKISNFEGFITTNDICKLLIGSTGYDYLKSCGLSEAQLAATHDSEEKANLLRSLDVSFVPSKRGGKWCECESWYMGPFVCRELIIFLEYSEHQIWPFPVETWSQDWTLVILYYVLGLDIIVKVFSFTDDTMISS